jgi:hypothetical protein
MDPALTNAGFFLCPPIIMNCGAPWRRMIASAGYFRLLQRRQRSSLTRSTELTLLSVVSLLACENIPGHNAIYDRATDPQNEHLLRVCPANGTTMDFDVLAVPLASIGRLRRGE